MPFWPEFDSLLTSFMVLEADSHVETNFKASRMDFWAKTAPEVAIAEKSNVQVKFKGN